MQYQIDMDFFIKVNWKKGHANIFNSPYIHVQTTKRLPRVSTHCPIDNQNRR